MSFFVVEIFHKKIKISKKKTKFLTCCNFLSVCICQVWFLATELRRFAFRQRNHAPQRIYARIYLGIYLGIYVRIYLGIYRDIALGFTQGST